MDITSTVTWYKHFNKTKVAGVKLIVWTISSISGMKRPCKYFTHGGKMQTLTFDFLISRNFSNVMNFFVVCSYAMIGNISTAS